MWCVQDLSAKNRSRSSREALELEDILAEERKQKLKRLRDQQAVEETEKKAKIRNKEKLIDDLMFGEADADTILEQHREQLLLEKKTVVTFSTGSNI
jgi:CDK-activating kinase assembly factor MAT1